VTCWPRLLPFGIERSLQVARRVPPWRSLVLVVSCPSLVLVVSCPDRRFVVEVPVCSQRPQPRAVPCPGVGTAGSGRVGSGLAGLAVGYLDEPRDRDERKLGIRNLSISVCRRRPIATSPRRCRGPRRRRRQRQPAPGQVQWGRATRVQTEPRLRPAFCHARPATDCTVCFSLRTMQNHSFSSRRAALRNFPIPSADDGWMDGWLDASKRAQSIDRTHQTRQVRPS
jgi:hypothetical protein